MKLLLDTSTFLLLNLNPSRVSSAAYRACASLDNDRYLSVVSVWEIALKYSAGKLALPEPPALYVPARREVNQISSLRLDERSCFHLAQLGSDERHRDPFWPDVGVPGSDARTHNR